MLYDVLTVRFIRPEMYPALQSFRCSFTDVLFNLICYYPSHCCCFFMWIYDFVLGV